MLWHRPAAASSPAFGRQELPDSHEEHGDTIARLDPGEPGASATRESDRGILANPATGCCRRRPRPLRGFRWRAAAGKLNPSVDGGVSHAPDRTAADGGPDRPVRLGAVLAAAPARVRPPAPPPPPPLPPPPPPPQPPR